MLAILQSEPTLNTALIANLEVLLVLRIYSSDYSYSNYAIDFSSLRVMDLVLAWK